MFTKFNLKNFILFFAIIIFYSFIISSLYPQKQIHSNSSSTIPISLNLNFQQIKTDTLFNSPQIISILSIPKNSATELQFDLAHHPSELIKTSQFAKNENALAAINGGFFNMDDGGSVTYLEEMDSIYHRNIPHGVKWAIASWAKTGAVIIQKNGQLKIEIANTQAFYETSKAEASVLITGPMLIEKGQKLKLKEAKFVKDSHPRTCICETSTGPFIDYSRWKAK